MPIFTAYLPRARFTSEQKHALADAFNQALVQGLGIPKEDRFVVLSEHGPDELFLHPTFMGMNRNSEDSILVTVLLGAHRPLSDKKALVSAISRLVCEAVGISPDDIFITLIPVPNENFSFGRGELQLADSAPRW